MDQENLYNHWDITREYYDDANAAARQVTVSGYLCPARRTAPAVSTSGDLRGSAGAHVPGACGDYAASAGDYPNSPHGTIDDATNGDGALVQAMTTINNGVITAWASRTRLDSLTDGTSNTILVGEKHVPKSRLGMGQAADGSLNAGDGSLYNGEFDQNAVRVGGSTHPLATSPSDAASTGRRPQFGSWHTSVCHVVMGDGGVRALPTTLNPAILRLLVVRNDGEVIPNF